MNTSKSMSTRGTRNGHRRQRAGMVAALVLTSSLLSACGSDGGKAQLVWYTNPDGGTQSAIAKQCSTDRYTITTQQLPQDAGQQRVQLARRLAAGDDSIDLMSLDPAYTGEFANAGFLVDLPGSAEADMSERGTFDSALTAASWQDHLVAYPFTSNTQVLWYRKSFVAKSGLDMTQPVTWDQIIENAAKNHGTVAVQANKYEGYVVWINALIAGAGGAIITDPQNGLDASVTIGQEPGQIAAQVIRTLAHSKAATPDMSVSNEGTSGSAFATADGAFMTNWTYIFHNYDASDPAVAKDIGYARYPQSVAGQDSAPPYGGLEVAVSDTTRHRDFAIEAARCATSVEHQAQMAEKEGLMPSSAQGYAEPAVQKLFPADLLKLFEDSVATAAPRPISPYWSDISTAIQSTWHPPNDVNSATPRKSADLIPDAMQGKALM